MNNRVAAHFEQPSYKILLPGYITKVFFLAKRVAFAIIKLFTFGYSGKMDLRCQTLATLYTATEILIKRLLMEGLDLT